MNAGCIEQREMKMIRMKSIDSYTKAHYYLLFFHLQISSFICNFPYLSFTIVWSFLLEMLVYKRKTNRTFGYHSYFLAGYKISSSVFLIRPILSFILLQNNKKSNYSTKSKNFKTYKLLFT